MTVIGLRQHQQASRRYKVFANVDAAEKWFEENDPEGVAFEYEDNCWHQGIA